MSFVARVKVPRLLGRLHVAVFRLTGGLLGGTIAGRRILLLTTTGRRSGQRVTVPLLYVEDGGAPVVIASSGGSPGHPAWYLNLQANPVCEVRLGRRLLRARSVTLQAEERAKGWAMAVAVWRSYDDYQRKTTRVIPVVRLEPISSPR
jgi:deazaflavin-dependent oxidoreductase (nitroreductase family)